MKTLLLCFCFLPLNLWAQINAGPKYTSLGSACTALQDVWSIQQNAAGIAAARNPSFAIAYLQNFVGSESATQSALVVIPVRNNVVGFSIQNYGFKEYREQSIKTAYAKRFGDDLFMSVGLTHHLLAIENYGSATAITVDAGVQYRLSEKLFIGSHISNPNQGRYLQSGSLRLPVSLSTGVAYHASDKLILAVDVKKVLERSTEIRSGLEYSLTDKLQLRYGLSTGPLQNFGGFGLRIEKFTFEGAISFHQQLNLSPQVGIRYEI